MSWLSIPLPNPFKSLQLSNNDEGDDEDEEVVNPQNDVASSTIGESIGRQFRALISPETSNSGDGSGSPSSRTFEGIRSDFEEIKGTFKSSLSIFSTNKTVSEISKLASSFLQLNDESDVDFVNSNSRNSNNNTKVDDEEEEEDDDDVVGINDQVVEFAQQISNRRELWTEFPLSLDHEFDMSEAQYEHASVIEQLVPSLADLRSNISSHKSENQFWMIYFILLLPRLTGEDLELLSTPEIVEARATLLKMLQAKKSEIKSENPQLDSSNDSENDVRSAAAAAPMISEDSNASSSHQNNKKLLEAEDGNSFTSVDPNSLNTQPGKIKSGFGSEGHGKVDSWGSEENPVTPTKSAAARKHFQSEDDVSFSDLDDDDNDNDLPNRKSNSGSSKLKRTSSPEVSNDWVRLNKNVGIGGSKVSSQSSLRDRDSEGEDSTGWLTVDDFDS